MQPDKTQLRRSLKGLGLGPGLGPGQERGQRREGQEIDRAIVDRFDRDSSHAGGSCLRK